MHHRPAAHHHRPVVRNCDQMVAIVTKPGFSGRKKRENELAHHPTAEADLARPRLTPSPGSLNTPLHTRMDRPRCCLPLEPSQGPVERQDGPGVAEVVRALAAEPLD
jgi:hypothetical protein